MTKLSIPFLLFVIIVAHACSVKKFIPEGEQLYTGGEVDMEADFRIPDQKEIESELNALLKPEPNSKILGMRIGLWAHYKGSQERSEEHTSELQSRENLVCRLLLE